ncbi:MAG: tetratricopeptide repeat protein [Caryophanon sp.]|nr:tetratricopeptide repeat protein [Caryophanon sp.]
MKRKEPLQRKGNMIVFPGVVERTLEVAHEHAEYYRYDEAVEEFEKAFDLAESPTRSLLAYAYCLYEVRRFADARDVCERVLTHPNIPMIEVMELYLTVCIELKEYAHVQTLASNLLQQSLTDEQREKIERVQLLNEKIIERLEGQQTVNDRLNTFLTLPIHEQDQFVSALFQQNIRPYQDTLIRYAENASVHPLIRATLLTVFCEQQINCIIHYPIDERTIEINPTELIGSPFDMPQYKQLIALAQQQLDADPSKLELVEDVIKRHALYVYPLDWETFCGYTSAEMFGGYVQYIELLFGQRDDVDEDMLSCIQQMELNMNVEM